MQNTKTFVTAVIFTCTALSSLAIAHDGATGVVKERMDAMKEMKRSMKAMAPVFKGVLPYKPAEVIRNVEIINSLSGEHLTTLYPEGSDQRPSEARKTIWTEWENFSKLASEMERLSSELITAAEQNPDNAPVKAFKAMAKNCKACHDKYRED